MNALKNKLEVLKEIRAEQPEENHENPQAEGLIYFGMLRGIGWLLVIDVSGQPLRPVFEGQGVQEDG
jgi:hypothetical protein